VIDPLDAGNVWGALAPVPAATISGFGLSAEGNDLLTSPGLPVSTEPLFETVALQEVSTASGPLVQFGTDFGTRMCVRAPDGPVWSVPDRPDMPTRYVNSNPNSFAVFLLETCRARKRFPDLGDEQIDQLIGEVEQRLLAVDASAFSDPDSWWAIIYEQFRDGRL